ncbi:EamA family transporter [Clostridiales bacterium]|nr:EamA family transporter [Clostridiales bacterium]
MEKAVNKYYLFMFGSVILSSLSQILLKLSARKSHGSFLKEYLNPLVIAGYGLMVAATLTTIAAYQGMDYKNGPIIESLGYILVMVLSYFLLKEKVTRKKILGYCMILAGVIIFYL